jgi:hypothetical protein
VVYAPLLLGVATVVFEGTPAYPGFSRYWDIVDQYEVTQFYVAPTALRLLKRAGDEHVKAQMKHLRILGSVGEPIAAEVWKWYFDVVGKQEAHIVDVSNGCLIMKGSADKYRHTGKQKPALTSSHLLVVSHPPSRAAPPYHFSVSILSLSILFPAKRFQAMMSKASSLSGNRGQAWLVQFGATTRDTGIHI